MLSPSVFAQKEEKMGINESQKSFSCEGFSSLEKCNEAKSLIYDQSSKDQKGIIKNSYDICEMDPDNEICEKEKEGKR